MFLDPFRQKTYTLLKGFNNKEKEVIEQQQGYSGSDGYGFINEHYRNIIFNGIHEFTVPAYQSIPGLIEFNIAFAFWATEYIQEFFAYRHDTPLLLIFIKIRILHGWLEDFTEG